MKFFIVSLFFLVLFVYVTLKSFEVGPRGRTPLHDESIRRFLHRVNEDRDFMASVDSNIDYGNHPKNRRQAFPLSGSVLHPLILRRLAKRSKRQVHDEFMLNTDIYGLDKTSNTDRLFDNVPLSGGFYGR